MSKRKNLMAQLRLRWPSSYKRMSSSPFASNLARMLFRRLFFIVTTLLTLHMLSLYFLHWSLVIPQSSSASSVQSRSIDSLLTSSTSIFIKSTESYDEDDARTSGYKKSHLDKPIVAFITYELYPVSRRGGGAGVVINGLVQELLENGHDVVMLADIARPYLIEWQQHIHSRLRSTQNVGMLHVFQTDSVMGLDSISFSKSVFMRKSRMFAQALSRVHRIVPFDIIECFDYAGAAFELLRPKGPGFDGDGGDYLPDSVGVSIRFHGTLQLIERAEGKEAPLYPPSERSIMYLQEQFSLMSADLLFCQTKAMKERLSEHYMVKPEHVHLAPVPMNSILKYVDDAMRQIPDDVEFTADKNPRKFLIYGRMQLVKGLETVIKAAIMFLEEHADEKFEFLFVGPDIWLTDGNQWTSTYLSTLVPPKYKSQIILNNMPIDRSELATLSKQVYAAIFASQFESLNLAVHEIARMDVPLLLSDIPPFVEFFNGTRIAHLFHVSNEQSLRDALNWLVFSEQGQQMVQDAQSGLYRLKYQDSTSVYRNYIIPEPRRRWSGEVLQLAAHINEQEDILNKKISSL